MSHLCACNLEANQENIGQLHVADLSFDGSMQSKEQIRALKAKKAAAAAQEVKDAANKREKEVCAKLVLHLRTPLHPLTCRYAERS